VPAQFHQAHGFFEPQTPNALAEVLLCDEPLGGIGVHLSLVHLCAGCYRPLGHCHSY
jgi:hypothetical protein